MSFDAVVTPVPTFNGERPRSKIATVNLTAKSSIGWTIIRTWSATSLPT